MEGCEQCEPHLKVENFIIMKVWLLGHIIADFTVLRDPKVTRCP